MIFFQNKFDEEMEAVATTGLYPRTTATPTGSEIDAKYGLMKLAARTASPGMPINRASYPQVDQQQQQQHHL